jgi:hypothetical protein
LLRGVAVVLTLVLVAGASLLFLVGREWELDGRRAASRTQPQAVPARSKIDVPRVDGTVDVDALYTRVLARVEAVLPGAYPSSVGVTSTCDGLAELRGRVGFRFTRTRGSRSRFISRPV